MLGPNIAVREDFECREEFFAEVSLPSTDTGECGGRADHRSVADLSAVVRFDAPDGSYEVAIDAESFLDRVEGGTIFGEDCAPGLDAGVIHQQVEIIPE